MWCMVVRLHPGSEKAMAPLDQRWLGEMEEGEEGGRRLGRIEPGLKPFAVGALVGAVVFPVFVTRSRASRLLPGVTGAGEALVTCCLVALGIAAIACLCFLLGRKVLEQRRIPCRWRLPLPAFSLLGATVQAAFLGTIAFTDWSHRVVGLPWALGVGLPFLYGAYVGVCVPRVHPGEGVVGGTDGSGAGAAP